MAEKALTAAFFVMLALFTVEYITTLHRRKPKDPRCIAFVVPDNDPDGLESLLMYAYSRLKCGFNREGTLYFINDDANEEEKRIADIFCKDHHGSAVISKENLCDILGDTVYKTVRFVLY